MLYQSKSHSSHVLTLIFFISNWFRAQNFIGIRYFHVNFTHRIDIAVLATKRKYSYASSFFIYHPFILHRSLLMVSLYGQNIINMDYLLLNEFEFIYRLDVNALSKRKANEINTITVRLLINNFC